MTLRKANICVKKAVDELEESYPMDTLNSAVPSKCDYINITLFNLASCILILMKLHKSIDKI